MWKQKIRKAVKLVAHRSLSDVLETNNPDWGSFWKKQNKTTQSGKWLGLLWTSSCLLYHALICQFVSIIDTDFCLTDCRIITFILKNKRKKSRSWKPGYTLAILTLDPPLKAVWPWGPAPQLSCSFFLCKQGSVTSPTLPIIYMTLCSLPVYSSPPSPAGLWVFWVEILVILFPSGVPVPSRGSDIV